MCFFKKKKEKIVVIGNKYKVNDFVHFKYRGEVAPGYIYDVRYGDVENIIYDIQIGGECPAIIKDVEEKDIFLR